VIGKTSAVLVIGHRGASAIERENTPAAFEAADRLGADGVELDVRLAVTPNRGPRLVVFHDPLPDVTTADGAASVDALPGFDEVLDACGDRMLVNVEIKNSAEEGGFDPTMAVVGPTIEAMRRRGRESLDRWMISSFSLPTIDHCRVVAPEYPTAHLVWAVDEIDVASARSRGHVAVHPWETPLVAEQVDMVHDSGLAVNVWTPNDRNRIRELRDMGVDGVCTDVPDVALEALGRSEVAITPSWGTRA